MDYNVRSWLCGSALNSKLIKKSNESSADIITFDLEDSVPTVDKETARLSLGSQLNNAKGNVTSVRINDLCGVEGYKDLLHMASQNIIPDIIIIPKANLLKDLDIVSSILGNDIRIFAIVEQASTLHQLQRLEYNPPSLSGVIFGLADFSEDLGLNPQNAKLNYIKQQILLEAARLNLIAIDSPCFSIESDTDIMHECKSAKDFGFKGKVSIHPKHISVINQSFCISEQELADAKLMLVPSDSKRSAAISVKKGFMLGPPFYKYAKKLIRQGRTNR